MTPIGLYFISAIISFFYIGFAITADIIHIQTTIIYNLLAYLYDLLYLCDNVVIGNRIYIRPLLLGKKQLISK
jgi:hypothetical protein